MIEAEISALSGPLPEVPIPQTVVGDRLVGSLLEVVDTAGVATEVVVEVVDTAGVAPSSAAVVGELDFSTSGTAIA